MTKLETLIDQLCPEGVEWKALGDIGRVAMCKRIMKAETSSIGEVPFYKIGTFGKQADAYISGKKFLEYKKKYSFPQKGDILISAAGTIGRTLRYDGNPAYYQDSNIVWLEHDESEILNTFLQYYYQLSPWNTSIGGTISRLYNDDIRKIKIPTPPLAVQEEIVKILDNFTELTAELTAELSARKKQYEYYREKLLTLGDDVEWVKIKDICKKISSGGTPLKSKTEYYRGNIPWLRTQEVRFTDIVDVQEYITDLAIQNTSAKWIPENCVIVAISGATAGRCAINKIPLTTNQHCCNLEIDASKALYRYVFFWIYSQYEKIKGMGEGARQDINNGKIGNYPIPIPSLAEQERIVAILDRFNALCNDLTSGLPAEIAARQKQYEYYRDKLLSFKEKEESVAG